MYLKEFRSIWRLIRSTLSSDERERTTARFKLVLEALMMVTVGPIVVLITSANNDFVQALPLKFVAVVLALLLAYPFNAFIGRTMFRDDTHEVVWLDLDPSAGSAIQRNLFHHMAILSTYTLIAAGAVALHHEGEISTGAAATALVALFVLHVGAAALVGARATRIWTQPSNQLTSPT